MINEKLEKYKAVSNKYIREIFKNNKTGWGRGLFFPELSEDDEKSITQENICKELAKKIQEHYDSDNDIYAFDEALACLADDIITNNYLRL